MNGTSEMTSKKLDNNGLIPTDVSNFQYEKLADNTIKITKYTGTDLYVVIPNYIDGCEVTIIGSSAFRNTGITSIHFSDFVKTIESSNTTYFGSFTGTNLGKLTIPGSIKNLGDYAFTDAGITELTLDEGVEKIGSHTFYKNYFSALKIPDSMLTIGYYAFTNVGLINLDLGNGVETLDGWSFRSNKLIDVYIPKSVKVLNIQAFVYNPIEKINISENLHDYIIKNPTSMAKSVSYDGTLQIFKNYIYYDEEINYY